MNASSSQWLQLWLREHRESGGLKDCKGQKNRKFAVKQSFPETAIEAMLGIMAVSVGVLTRKGEVCMSLHP